jgi:predicted enzyme related to lactoylglutathione lyase
MPNPFCHVELSTDDVAASKKFYKSLFDWKVDSLGKEMGGYTMIDVGKGVGGGMMQKMMPEQPTAWLPYVEVDDVKKTLAKARKLGAQVKVDYMAIPGGMGAFGVFVDPSGAGLGVWEAAKKKAKAKKKSTKKKK